MVQDAAVTRHIVGGFVPRYDVRTTKDGILLITAKMLLDAILVDATKPDMRNLGFMISAEANDRESVTFAGATLGFMTKADLRGLIKKIKKPLIDSVPDELQQHSGIVFAIGSREFCSLWAKFWSQDKEAPQKWGADLMAAFRRAKRGQAFWCDSAKNDMRVQTATLRPVSTAFLH